ncbi:hypothetical protein NITHO_6800001 [Nitrolancea hollandica Lb]|uniref:Uncharacterized protein n=1 Tax=Nitrolancea hollandica Lb TaxID=1129897 RepID=I4EMX7_9BACT|nr:hypothetical protein NITHO_6800001 [Nitrolancea hollandica Lb]
MLYTNQFENVTQLVKMLYTNI